MSGGFLPARLLQLVGLAVFIGSVVFWALTGRESTLFVSAAMSLILLGSYGRLVGALTRKDIDPSPPPVEKKDEGQSS